MSVENSDHACVTQLKVLIPGPVSDNPFPLGLLSFWIQNFICFLNGSTTYTQPTLTDPLDNLPGQTGFETADSSVRPTDGAGHTAYNFAIARVRLRGATLDRALNCRAFFRLFVGQSCDTDFQPSTTCKSTQGTSAPDTGHPVFALPSAVATDPSGQTLQTTPYFATDINGTHGYDERRRSQENGQDPAETGSTGITGGW